MPDPLSEDAQMPLEKTHSIPRIMPVHHRKTVLTSNIFQLNLIFCCYFFWPKLSDLLLALEEQDETEKQLTAERRMGPQDKIRNQFSLISLLSLSFFFPPLFFFPLPYFNCLINLSWFLQTFKRYITERFYSDFYFYFSTPQFFKKLYCYFGNMSSLLGYSISKHIFFSLQWKSRFLEAASYRIFFQIWKEVIISVMPSLP